MKNICEIEPFAYGYLTADRDDIEYKTACGLREYAKHIPMQLENDSFFASFINRVVPYRVVPFGVSFSFRDGIAVDADRISDEMKHDPELAETLAEIRDKMLPYDIGKRIHAAFTEHENKLSFGLYSSDGHQIRTCWGGTWAGHANPDYRMLLRLGTTGLRERISVARKINRGRDDFYDALLIALDAIDILGERAKKRAKELGNKRIARAFENVPRNTPRNFFEACQMFWLVFSFDGIDSPGRFDYFMDDFCDLCTEAERKECISALWELFRLTRTWNLCIGGSDENGKYFSNALTYDILEEARSAKYNTPNLTMRVSASMPEDLWKSATKTIATGIGMPVLYNDECVCPALEDLGIPPRDSHEYCMNGCNQIDIFGKSHMGLEDGEVNIAKCLELALHNGRCALTGEMLGIETGDVSSLDSFDKFLSAYKRQVEYITDCAVEMSNKAQRLFAEINPNPLRSNLIVGCVENGRDYKDGGPVYNHGQILVEGIADVADSLAAVKHFVYDARKYSLEELVEALDRDFEGNEELYRDFSGYKKFGNDECEVDEICADIVGHFYGYLSTKRTFRGGIFGGGCSPFNRAAIYGGSVGALPNGKRKTSELFSDSIGAVPGNDKNGPTALLRSVLRQPQKLAKSGNVLNLKFTKQLFAGESAQMAFIALAKTYFRKGGQQLSVAVLSAEELREAQICPERYGDLIVRVGGYSDYFNNLSRGLQDNIIRRTEIGL